MRGMKGMDDPTTFIVGWDATIMTSPTVTFALDAITAAAEGNYVKFFSLAKSTTALNACLMHRHFEEVMPTTPPSASCLFSLVVFL